MRRTTREKLNHAVLSSLYIYLHIYVDEWCSFVIQILKFGPDLVGRHQLQLHKLW